MIHHLHWVCAATRMGAMDRSATRRLVVPYTFRISTVSTLTCRRWMDERYLEFGVDDSTLVLRKHRSGSDRVYSK